MVEWKSLITTTPATSRAATSITTVTAATAAATATTPTTTMATTTLPTTITTTAATTTTTTDVQCDRAGVQSWLLQLRASGYPPTLIVPLVVTLLGCGKVYAQMEGRLQAVAKVKERADEVTGEVK